VGFTQGQRCLHPPSGGGTQDRWGVGDLGLVALLAHGAGGAEGLTGRAGRAGGRRVHRATAFAPAGGRGAGGAAGPLGRTDVATVLGSLRVLVVTLAIFLKWPIPGLFLVFTLVRARVSRQRGRWWH
jgi:hypothetical protein